MSKNEHSEPSWNSEQSLIDALCKIRDVHDESSSRWAYHSMLFALGNNHAGTFYPIALQSVPTFEALLREGSPWSRHSMLNVLIDLCGSFEPEAGYELYQGRPLKTELIRAVELLVPVIEPISRDGSVAAQSAAELIEVIKKR